MRKYIIDVQKRGNKASLVFDDVRKYMRQLLEVEKEHSRVRPVDIVIDLSLFSKDEKDLEANLETWASLILSCTEVKNVNFIFELQNKNEKQDSPDENEVLRMLKDKIKTLSGAIPRELVKDIIDNRINGQRRDDAIEILICQKMYLESLRNDSRTLFGNQYPVAMDGVTTENGEVVLRDFYSALTVGLSKAALVIATERDAVSAANRDEFNELKNKILKKLNVLYESIFGIKDMIDERTLELMVDPSPIVRMNLAISLALRPITRMPISMLQELHDEINLFLRAA